MMSLLVVRLPNIMYGRASRKTKRSGNKPGRFFI
nr:MAG TPA: hypothetical protein [Bacteriophage sp.]DAR87778.1 MAG TPA: hypothetical protein [Caudoviricetes sp.]